LIWAATKTNSALCSAKEKPYIASMGIYVMQAKALKELLYNKLPDANDFGMEVIPGARSAGMKVQAHAFQVIFTLIFDLIFLI
jgi:ADP-glucose pyrophosphorylase